MSPLRAIPADRRRRLIASARLLESDKAGEREAALSAIKRLLAADGLSLADLIELALPASLNRAPEPVAARSPWDMRSDPLRPWQDKARAVADHHEALNERELAFVIDMAGRGDAPTPRQRDWLDRLVARVQMRRAA